MTIFINHYADRSGEYDITISDADGTTVPLYSGDQVRLKIYRESDCKLMLDLISGTPTSNGSSLTRANPTRFKVDQDDVDWTPAIYEIEVLLVDASDADRTKHADMGVFVLHESPGGNLGT